jgi:pectate lyase
MPPTTSTWDSAGSGGVNADSWTSTTTFPRSKLTYTYSPATAQCVKDRLINVVGVGKNLATLSCN